MSSAIKFLLNILPYYATSINVLQENSRLTIQQDSSMLLVLQLPQII